VKPAGLLWPLLLVLALLFGAGGALSAVQLEKPAHRATAQALIHPATILDISIPPVRSLYVAPSPQREIAIARDMNLVERVLRAANVSGLTAAEFLDHSRVTARSGSDNILLGFSVTSTSSVTAIRLANIYASEYAYFKHQQFRATIDGALRSLRTRIASLPDTPLRKTLEQQAKQLSQIRRQELSSMTVLQPASATTPVRKHALRNGIIGGLLGLLLAIALLLGLLRIFPALRPPRLPPIRTLIAGGMWDCNCRTCQEQRKAPLEAS
jgi:hypothetical protein